MKFKHLNIWAKILLCIYLFIFIGFPLIIGEERNPINYTSYLLFLIEFIIILLALGVI